MSSQPPRPPDWSRPGAGGPPSWEPSPRDPRPYPDEQADPFAPARPADAYGRPEDPAAWPPGRGQGAPPRGGGGRKAAAAAGLVAVAVVGSVGGYWLGHRGGAPAAGAATPVPSASASDATSAPATPARRTSPTPARRVALSGVAEVDAGDARAQVKKAGVPVQGKGVEAWGWTDTNGQNLLLTTKSVEKAEGSVVRAATLHVYHLAGLDGKPRSMLTPLRDSGVSDCDVDFLLDFVPGSIQVSDTNGDGYGEATVGWASLCAGDPEPERIKLALVTKGTYYILRGTGQRATDPEPPSGITFAKATFTPNVPAARWPAGTYRKTVDLFNTVFK
jgi:hypothetical protein